MWYAFELMGRLLTRCLGWLSGSTTFSGVTPFMLLIFAVG
jgi:hypothetical protein